MSGLGAKLGGIIALIWLKINAKTVSRREIWVDSAELISRSKALKKPSNSGWVFDLNF